MTTTILHKLDGCKTAWDVEHMLLSMGAKQIGSGHFARVYRIETYKQPQPTWNMSALSQYLISSRSMEPVIPHRSERTQMVSVIKVVRKPDKGALMVARAAMATHMIDPLAPVYHGITEFADGTWVAELEELWPQEILEGLHGSSSRQLVGDGTGATFARRPTEDVIKRSIFLSLISSYVKKAGASWDMHGANVMMRGDQPVVTDPIFCNCDL